MVSTSITNWKPVINSSQIKVQLLSVNFRWPHGFSCCQCPCLLNFKIILTELLINRFSSRKCKGTAEEHQLTVKLTQPLKEPNYIVQFTEKRQRCQYCFINRKRMSSVSLIVNPVMFFCVSTKTEIVSNCIIPFESNCTISQYADELLTF